MDSVVLAVFVPAFGVEFFNGFCVNDAVSFQFEQSSLAVDGGIFCAFVVVKVHGVSLGWYRLLPMFELSHGVTNGASRRWKIVLNRLAVQRKFFCGGLLCVPVWHGAMDC